MPVMTTLWCSSTQRQEARLIGHQRRRDAAEEGEGAHVARDEVVALLRRRRLGVGVVGGAQHRDEELYLDGLTGLRVDVVWLLPRVVDEGLVAGAVLLAHGESTRLEPLSVVLAEGRVAVAVRVPLEVLEVQQLQRHADASPLGVHIRARAARWPRARRA
jgi:hypothetical protein